jgi:Protein of unknown function (DUF1573)
MSTTIQRIFSAAFAVLFLAASLQARQAAAPRAVVPLTDYAFGDIYKGEVISQIFVIRNEGKADLLITDFVGACGCEVLDVDRVIAPDKQGRARIEINTASQPGGEMFKMAMLHTNDPERPTIRLSFTANLLTSGNGGPVNGVELRPGKHVGPVFVGPDTAASLTAAPGKTARAEFIITVERGPLNLFGLKCDCHVIKARLETVEPGKQYKIIVENLPAAAEGSYQTQLRVLTDSAVLPDLPLTVRTVIRDNM